MKILLTGSVAFDYLMKFPGYFREHFLPDRLDSISLSFLVESMDRVCGGVTPNIAYTLALLGGKPAIWAAVGDDFEEYRRFLESKGVDTSGARVIPGVATASFFVNTDRSNAQIASFFPGAMAYASQLSLRELSASPPDLVLISPNEPGAMNQYVVECQEMDIPYFYDPSQQIVRLTAEDLKLGIRGARALFVNEYEFALIEKMTRWGLDEILEINPQIFIVVTQGEDGASIRDHENSYHIPVVTPELIADPTGVGDAFRGGFLTGFSLGLELGICGRMGSLAATYCLEKPGPQSHAYTTEEFITRYRQHFDDVGELERVLTR